MKYFLLYFLAVYSVQAFDVTSIETDKGVKLKPSVIIGSEVDWIPAASYPETSIVYKRSQLVGQLISSKRTKCTAWVHPVNGEVYTANHCFKKEHKWAEFYWLGDKYILDKWFCDSVKDYCKTLTFGDDDARVDSGFYSNANFLLDGLPGKRDAYLIHRQRNQTVVSTCEVKTHPSIPYWLIEYGDRCDTYFGSSGGMLINESCDVIGIHHSGSPNDQQNYASKLGRSNVIDNTKGE